MTLSVRRRLWAVAMSLALAHCGTRDGDPGPELPLLCRNRTSGAWMPMRSGPPPTVHPAGFWTGSEVIIWGGNLQKSDPLSNPPITAPPNGWLYSPVEDSWRPMAGDSPPELPDSYGVWTGSELLNFVSLRRYDVANDEWRDIPTPEWINRKCLGCVGNPVWTGSVVLLHSGRARFLAFDPSRNEWSDLSITGLPETEFCAVVWIGDSLFALTRRAESRGAFRFFPDTETWTPASMVGMPVWGRSLGDRCWLVWTGDRLLGWCTDPPRAAAYDPGRDEWQAIAADGAAEGVGGDVMWTGSEAVFWGHRGVDGSVREFGSAYDPKRGTWRTLTADGAPRSGHAMVWTGCEIVVWGGYDMTVEGYLNVGHVFLDTGFVLRP